jgi:hypothetical protein
MNQFQTIYTQIIDDFKQQKDFERRAKMIREIRQLLSVLESHHQEFQKHRFLIPINQEIDFRSALKSQKKEWEKDKRKTEVNLTSLGLKGLRPMELQTCKYLQSIPEAFVWLSSADYKEGIYCSPIQNVYVRVQLADVYYSKEMKSQLPTIKCRYNTIANCKNNTWGERECTFVHQGETFQRVGNVARCMSVPRLGNKQTLALDLRALTLADINTILMHSIADLFIVSLWYQSNYKSKVFVFEDIDKCM